MLLLALDTSGKSGSVAVLQDEKILFEQLWPAVTSLTAELPGQIKQALDKTGLTLEEMEGFALSLGPGSFTGLRVGLGLVKGLAFSNRRPVMGVSTLKALAFSLRDYQASVPMLDARRDEIYGAFFEHFSKGLQSLLADRAQNPRAFLAEVEKICRQKKYKPVFFGSGLRRYREVVEEIFSNQTVFLPEDFDRVRASSVGLLGLEAYHRGDFSPGGEELVPRYLRASEAEIKQEAAPFSSMRDLVGDPTG